MTTNPNVVNGIDLRDHLGLAGTTVKRYRWAVGASLDEDDLMQAALMGLTRAAQRFEPERGYRFSTYATHWVRRYVKRLISNEGRTVRVPVHVHGQCWREKKPLPCPTSSLDAPSVRDGGDGATSLLQRLASEVDSPEDEAADARQAERIPAMVDELPERLRLVVRARYFEGATLVEVGERLGVTRERVRQLQVAAMSRLRDRLVGEEQSK